MPLETFQQATHQNTTIPQILGPTSISTNTTTHYTPARVIQHTGHIQIQWDYYNLCHQSTELNQLQTSTWCKRSLLPFLGTTLSWLTGTATTKDICSIKTRINQLIATQTSQCNTLVHIVSILNVTRYAKQVNRHSINNLIDAIHTTSQDINNLYNLTTSLAASINFNQMVLHIRSVFANLWDSLHYLHTVSTHTMDYINAATSSILSPYVLPVVYLQKMLQHIADTLPPTLHLPISPEDTLHFYRYLCTHVLIENKQFLLLVDIPIQDRACQITIHEVFTLDIPHGNYSPHYDINTRYFGTLYCTISDMPTG